MEIEGEASKGLGGMLATWFSLGRVLTRQAMSTPHHSVLLWPGGSMTYAEFNTRTNRLANALLECGLHEGDRVALISENSPEYVEWIFALAKIGAIAVPINIRLAPAEILYVLQDAGIRGLFAGRLLFQQAHSLTNTLEVGIVRVAVGDPATPLPGGWLRHDQLIEQGSPRPIGYEVAGDATAVLLYTSGTTGRPKGCMLSHRAWLANGANIMGKFGVGSRDVYLAALPFFHVAGLGMMIAHIQAGGAVLPMAKWDPEYAVSLVRDFGVTSTFLVPPMLSQFVEAASPHDAPSMRLIVGAAGFEPPDRVSEAERRFGAVFFGIYGQTEAGNIVTAASSEEIRAKPGTYGTFLPLFDFRLVDEEGHDVERGTVGELVLRGPSIMTGYWRNEQATHEAFRDGWLRTGDLFVLEPDGSLRMVDRAKYLIKTGGENVYPQEVELVLLRHPAVLDAAVVGVPDATWGESVKAFVVLQQGAKVTGRDLGEWVRRHLAPYKRPRYVEFVSEIPRNHSGKVLKETLKVRPVTADQRVD